MATSKPYAGQVYELATCTLQPFAQDDACEIGERLSRIDLWLAAGYTAARLTEYLRGEDPALNRFLILERAEKAGVVCVRYPWLHGPYLELIGLFPGFQGRGLGMEVMGWFEEQVKGRSRNLWILVSSFNEGGRRFYQRAGFSEIIDLPDLVQEGYREILLRKGVRA